MKKHKNYGVHLCATLCFRCVLLQQYKQVRYNLVSLFNYHIFFLFGAFVADGKDFDTCTDYIFFGN